MIYVEARRKEIKAAGAMTSMLEVCKQMGSEWLAMSPSQKEVYQRVATEEKVRYDKALQLATSRVKCS